MDKLFTASDKGQLVVKQEHVDPATAQHTLRGIFRYRIKLTKTGILRYFSHLDWQNTFFKAISRSDLNVAFSFGYNPTMKILNMLKMNSKEFYQKNLKLFP